MLKFFPIHGGWFSDALPTGEWAALIPRSHIQTSFGRVELPEIGTEPGFLGPRFLRISQDPLNGFQMAGQADKSIGTWHYKFGKWTLDPRVSNGESAHIFDHAGTLHIIEPAAHQTSQGYRYVSEDGRLVRGDDTILRENLSQWSRLGGVTIGQGRSGLGGVFAVQNALRVVLSAGIAYFIRVHFLGGQFSVAWVTTGAAMFLWFALSDLSSFPKEIVDAPIVIPPDPEPESEPEPMALPNHLDTLNALRAQYPAQITTAQAVGILNLLAWAHRDEGFGLLAKPNGNHGPQPVTGIFCSADWIVNRNGLGCDVFADGPSIDAGDSGPARTQWGHGEPYDVSRFVAPVHPIGAVVPDDEPDDDEDDPIVPPDLAPLLEQLRAALAENTQTIGRLWEFLGGMNGKLIEIERQLADLQKGPSGAITFPVYKAKIFGQAITLTPQDQP